MIVSKVCFSDTLLTVMGLILPKFYEAILIDDLLAYFFILCERRLTNIPFCRLYLKHANNFLSAPLVTLLQMMQAMKKIWKSLITD